MSEGTYPDRNGVLITVRYTTTGYELTYPDGHRVYI